MFLLSPADCAARRAQQLLRPEAESVLARKLRGNGGAPLGEVFALVSSLYFRGKLAYARAFARPPQGRPGVFAITPGDGLVPPESTIGTGDLRRWSRIPVDPDEKRYRRPFQRSLEALVPEWGDGDVVLLGSIASGKYVDLLLPVLGERLLFPADFVGRGDMSRGGLMLRCVDAGRELPYVPLQGAARSGARPPRLPPRVTPPRR